MTVHRLHLQYVSANGYSSTFAAEVGNNVMEYYYKVTPENELITGEASNIGIGSNGGD